MAAKPSGKPTFTPGKAPSKASGTKTSATKTSSAKTSGRTTPQSGRYTAPKPKTEHHSPFWLPVLMATAFLTGLAVIVLNYLNLLPGDQPENRYLFLGLGWVVVGFILAANYK